MSLGKTLQLDFSGRSVQGFRSEQSTLTIVSGRGLRRQGELVFIGSRTRRSSALSETRLR